jgi:DNA mismatch repair ATPase MutS
MERLSQEGLPVSRPRILDPAAAERPDSAGETNHAQTAKHAHVSQFYNIHLARRMMNRQHGAKQVVCNSLSMEDPRRIFILTGPNQGGKTTFVQGLGLLHVLIQSGLFAPAAEAYIRPVDRILTHFPHAEQGSTSTGRFSEELQRLSHMLRHVTGNSLLLLNESLASTNPVEASSVAQELIKALRTVGARAIFATHLHDLAHEIDRINAEVDATATVSHLRAEVAENGGDDGTATRTFRIVEGPPGGSSYARDIARRHGMSYDQIVQDFRKRGLLSD